MTRERDRKLSLRRETVRRLSALEERHLARVAGGDFVDSQGCATVGKTSKYCPVDR